MQNNEKLVAVNERIEEAMNYRKELKDLEVKEAERVESLRQLNADKQRSALQTIQVSSQLWFNVLCFGYRKKRSSKWRPRSRPAVTT